MEELETQTDEEDLQYQIDMLTKSKEFLEGIPTNEELEAQKEVYEEWMATITDSNEQQVNILSQLKDAYTKIGEISGALTGWAEKDSGLLTDSEAATQALLQNAGAGSQTSIDTAINALSTSGLKEGSADYAAKVGEIQDQLETWKNNIQQSGIRNYNTYEEAQKGGFTGTEADFNTLKAQQAALDSGAYDKYEDYDTSRYSIDLGGQSFTVVPTENWGLTNEDIVQAKKNDASAFNDYRTGGARDKLEVFNNNGWEFIDDDGGTGQTWEIDPDRLDDYPVGTMLKSSNGGQREDKYAYKMNEKQWVKAFPENRLGTYSFEGGPTLINEEGTEGIITPQGTLTALPSKSGIIPADITKNLWSLGEAAPNLIKVLDSVNLDQKVGERAVSDDHSTNIQNLYATFQADENFDFDSFLIDVRSVINTTAHNS